MKKKKKFRLLILLLLVVILAGLAYWLLINYNTQQDSRRQETQSSPPLLGENFDAANLQTLSLTMDGNTLDFRKAEGAWYYADDTDFPLDQEQFRSFSSALTELTATRQLQDTLDNLSDFGLSEPFITVTAVDDNNNTVTVYVGNTTDTTGDSYAYLEGDSHIYTIPSSFAQVFGRDLMALIVPDEPPNITAEAIRTVTITKEDGTWEMLYKEKGDSSLDYTNTMQWFLTAPDGTRTGMDPGQAATLTAYLSSLTSNGCVDYNAGKRLADYGLDSPAASVTIHYGDSNLFRFDIGAAAEDNFYYMTWENSNQISLLKAQTADYLLELNEDTYATLTPCNIDAEYVKQLTITVDGISHEISPADSTKLYGLIRGLTGETLYPDQPSPDKSAKGNDITLEFVLQKLETTDVTINLVPYNNSYYTLSINKNPHCLVNKMDVLNLLKELN